MTWSSRFRAKDRAWFAMYVWAGCFAVAFGAGIATSVRELADGQVGSTGPTHISWETVAWSHWSKPLWATLLVAPLGYWSITRLLQAPRRGAGVPPGRAQHGRSLVAFAAVLGTIVAADGLLELVHTWTGAGMLSSADSAPSNAPGVAYLLLTAAAAGVGEELLVLAAPLLLFNRGARLSPAVVLLCLVLRTSYHLYYGWIAIPWTFAWGGGLLLIYRYYGRLWPVILAHTLIDILAPFNPSLINNAVFYSLAGLLVVPAVDVFRRRNTRSHWIGTPNVTAR